VGVITFLCSSARARWGKRAALLSAQRAIRRPGRLRATQDLRSPPEVLVKRSAEAQKRERPGECHAARTEPRGGRFPAPDRWGPLQTAGGRTQPAQRVGAARRGAADSVNSGEQLGGRNLQPSGQLENRVERRFPLAFLNPGNGGLVDARRPSKLLLSQPATLADARHVRGEDRPRTLDLGCHPASFAAVTDPLPARLSYRVAARISASRPSEGVHCLECLRLSLL